MPSAATIVGCRAAENSIARAVAERSSSSLRAVSSHRARMSAAVSFCSAMGIWNLIFIGLTYLLLFTEVRRTPIEALPCVDQLRAKHGPELCVYGHAKAQRLLHGPIGQVNLVHRHRCSTPPKQIGWLGERARSPASCPRPGSRCAQRHASSPRHPKTAQASLALSPTPSARGWGRARSNVRRGTHSLSRHA